MDELIEKLRASNIAFSTELAEDLHYQWASGDVLDDPISSTSASNLISFLVHHDLKVRSRISGGVNGGLCLGIGTDISYIFVYFMSTGDTQFVSKVREVRTSGREPFVCDGGASMCLKLFLESSEDNHESS